jgi:hypothetical protein
LQRDYYEAEQFRDRLSDWNRKFNELTDQPRHKLLQALQEERLGATGKMFPRATIEESVWFMINAREWIGPKFVDRESIPPGFWGSANIDWTESFAEGVTKERAVAYGLILVDVAELLKEFPLPDGDPYGGVESLNLAWHGARAERQGFNITLERSWKPRA